MRILLLVSVFLIPLISSGYNYVDENVRLSILDNKDWRKWQVAVFPPETFERYTKYKEHKKELLPIFEGGDLVEKEFYQQFNPDNPDFWLPL